MTLSIFCRKWRNWYQFGIFSKQIDYFNACKIRAHLTKKKLKRFASVGPSALPYSALDGIFNGLIIDCNFPEMTTFLPLFFCISMSKHSRRYREFVVTSRAERKRIRFPFSDRPAWAVLLKLLLFSCQLFQFGLFSRSANNNNKLFFC